MSPPGTPKHPGNAATAAGRAAPAAPEIAARLAEIAAAQAPLGTPEGAGRRIALPGARSGTGAGGREGTASAQDVVE